MKKRLTITLTTLSLLATQAQIALAQNLADLYAPGKAVGGKGVSIGQLVSVIIQDVSVLIGVLAFFTTLLAGINLLQSGGDPKKTKQGSDMLTYALIGMVLSVLAYWLTKIIFNVAGNTLF